MASLGDDPVKEFIVEGDQRGELSPPGLDQVLELG
jgi:hypothetical protein